MRYDLPMRTPLVTAAALLASATLTVFAAAPDDSAPFPPGVSTHTWSDREYDIVLPETPGDGAPRALVVIVASGGGYASDERSRQATLRNWQKIAADGWVACVPKSVQRRTTDDSWSSNEAEAITALALHLAGRLDVPEDRIHLFASGDVTGFAALVAFDKSARWRSVCFDRCKYRGGSLPKRMRSVGAMVAWDENDGPPDGHDKLVEALREKARSVDTLATDHVSGDPVFRWWLDAMDGRFEPGRDHSLAWADAPASPDALRAALAQAERGGLVWFHAPEDASSDAARALHVDVLFDADVREHGQRVLSFRAPLASAPELAQALEVTATPALVVLDAKGKVTERFDAGISAKDLAKALKRVRGR